MSVPAYSAEELTTRTADGSIDLNRLAATVSGLLELEATVTALAQWVNAQIQSQAPQTGPTVPDTGADPKARSGKK